MTEHASGPDAPDVGYRHRLRRRLRRVDPITLWFVGLLAVPGWYVDSLSFMQVFALFFLAPLWFFVAPVVDWLRPTDESDPEIDPRDWIHMGDRREYAVASLSLFTSFLNPIVVVGDLFQAFGGMIARLRHGGSVPDVEAYEQSVSYRLPFEGTWTVVNGSSELEHSHSWGYVNQRYAYDFVVTDADGRSRPEGSPPRVDAYYCYDEPVLAPAGGVVVDAWDADSEPNRAGGFSHPLKREIAGNYVTIQHAPDEYSVLAHLVPASVTVDVGDRVERGQPVGRCGHTGNSSEPHLHFQVQDHPDFALSAGRPIAFDHVALDAPTADALPATGGLDALSVDSATTSDEQTVERHERVHIEVGQRVRHVGPRDGSPSDETDERLHAESTVDPVSSTSPTGAGIGDASGLRRRPVVDLLKRGGLGACVAAVLSYLGGIFVDSTTIAAAILVVSIVATAYWAWCRFGPTEYRTRVGSIGFPLGLTGGGLVIAATDLSGVNPAAAAGLVGIGGFALYVVAGEATRIRLHEAFSARAG
ncbi:M23 family metallopeptidase [Halovivax gelatinilyticus]|uniref:M23 family metallopeptidase n=1 Tax=Halovivax gelatinilyticus TaxID=2961597 RepID=UPI0020CA6590|nr:M23 family metallopeptidase [Halovivax gelatinilyticus]